MPAAVIFAWSSGIPVRVVALPEQGLLVRAPGGLGAELVKVHALPLSPVSPLPLEPVREVGTTSGSGAAGAEAGALSRGAEGPLAETRGAEGTEHRSALGRRSAGRSYL